MSTASAAGTPSAPSTQFQTNWPRLKAFIDSPGFVNFILAVIVINSITMGLQTSKSINAAHGRLLLLIDHAALVIYIVEIILKLIVYRARFFLNGWNLFDFFIVGIAITPNMEQLAVLRTLRTLRALRSLRILSVVPEMRRVVNGLLAAIPGMASIIAIMGIIFYIAAILTTTLFGEAFPEWFGTLGASFYTLFQVMTMESWSMGIARPVMEKFPHAWAFFVPFIAIATFSVLNLFVAVIVNAVQSAGNAPETEAGENDATPLAAGPAYTPDTMHLETRIDALHAEIAALKKLLEKRA